jgi:hypothetical protein
MAPKPPPRHSDFVLRDVRDTIPSSDNVVEPISPTHLGAAAKQRYGQRGVLGTGGMGEVALVFDRQIGRDVALKQLRPEARRDDVARARFAREARIQGQLEHPAVVPVYDLGGADDGSLYFTMKRVRGTSLGDILSALASGESAVAKRFSKRRILTAFGQICLTAHYAHILTTIYLYSAVLGVIVLPAVVVGFLRSSYHRADLQTRLQTWQLHQLVPEGAPTRSGAGGSVAM